MMEQQTVENSGNDKQLPGILDGISAVCAIGGVIAAVVTNSAAVAVPLAGAIGVQLYNRRRLMEAMDRHTEMMIRAQNLHIVNHQNRLETLSEQLQQQPKDWQWQLEQHDRTHRERFGQQEEKIEQLQQTIDQLNQFTQSLETQHLQLADIVGELRQIENFSQALRANPSLAEMYYQRGLSHQRLGDRQGAIADFTQAVSNDPRSAKAYHSRGVLHADLGNRKAAVYDLREAAKLYFEGGDIESYQKARDLCRGFYNAGIIPVVEEVPEEGTAKPFLPQEVLVGKIIPVVEKVPAMEEGTAKPFLPQDMLVGNLFNSN